MAQKVNKVQINEAGDTAGYFSNTTQNTYTTQTTRLSGTLTNAPPGDYLVFYKFSLQPSGGGNCTVDLTMTAGGGTLIHLGQGVHVSDTDFSTSKFCHRSSMGIVKSHPGGNLTINVRFSPESAVNYVMGNAADVRWGTLLEIYKAG